LDDPGPPQQNGKAHTLPLMPMMREIIESVPRMAERDHLFGNISALGFTAWAGGKAALDVHSGVTGWRVHDIRRSVATHMANIGIAPHIVEQVLNHVSGHKSGVAGVYNRSSYELEVRNALALWADHIRVLVGGGERKVVAFVPVATDA
jgi:integrase